MDSKWLAGRHLHTNSAIVKININSFVVCIVPHHSQPLHNPSILLFCALVTLQSRIICIWVSGWGYTCHVRCTAHPSEHTTTRLYTVWVCVCVGSASTPVWWSVGGRPGWPGGACLSRVCATAGSHSVTKKSVQRFACFGILTTHSTRTHTHSARHI